MVARAIVVGPIGLVTVEIAVRARGAMVTLRIPAVIATVHGAVTPRCSHRKAEYGAA